MISRRELEQLRAEWTLDIAVIEKDYLLGWLLADTTRSPGSRNRHPARRCRR